MEYQPANFEFFSQNSPKEGIVPFQKKYETSSQSSNELATRQFCGSGRAL
jgi:hypothetical protein